MAVESFSKFQLTNKLLLAFRLASQCNPREEERKGESNTSVGEN